MGLVDRFQGIDIFWPALVAVGLLLVLAGLLRRMPPERRRNTLTPAIFLVLAFLLRAFAGVVDPGPALVLEFCTALALALSIAGFFNVIVFDLALRRAQVPSTLRDVVQAFLFLVLALFVLRRSGVDPFSLLTTSAVLTAVIGLALQNTIANLFAGLALSIERRLTLGDWIRVGGGVGNVREIGWRATSLLTKDGNWLIVPNSQLLGSDVLNYSKPAAVTRLTLKIPVHYRHPPGDVRRVLLESLRGAPSVLTRPAADSFPVEFGDSAVTYALRFWISDYERSEPIEGEVRARVWYALHRAGFEIPFPVRTIVDATPTAEREAAEAARHDAERESALAAVDLFAPLPSSDRQMLASGMRAVRFATGETIIHQGDPGSSMYVIARGRVAVLVGLDGTQREVATLGPGEFFGEMSLVTGEPRQATCVARDEVDCWLLGHDSVHRILAARPELAGELSSILTTRSEELEDEREDLSDELRGRRTEVRRGALLQRIRTFFQLDDL